jgi:hypothetical protein
MPCCQAALQSARNPLINYFDVYRNSIDKNALMLILKMQPRRAAKKDGAAAAPTKATDSSPIPGETATGRPAPFLLPL